MSEIDTTIRGPVKPCPPMLGAGKNGNKMSAGAMGFTYAITAVDLDPRGFSKAW